MGRVWRYTMVLLSTLAALVIIVHSAEEEYEAQYRRELRPRMLDTGTPRTYEQPWRTMGVEPAMQLSTPDDTWLEMSSDEPPRRVRLGRKRKRRPEPSEDLVPIQRYGYAEESVRPYFDVDSSLDRKPSDTPRKRRKKLEPLPERWDAPVEEDRPVRRRGQRRKRPSLETWPVFSEFNDYRPNASPREIDVPATTGSVDEGELPGAIDDFRHFDDRDNIQTRFIEPQTFDTTHKHMRPQIAEETEIKSQGSQDETLIKITDDRKPDDNRYYPTDLRLDASLPDIIEDKSLSEFTNEDITSVKALNIEHVKRSMTNKARDKSDLYFKEQDKSHGNRPIDPLTLKDILKRSNGTSLSEILQQHNLSLSDLLHGKENVISILKSEEAPAPANVTGNKEIAKSNTEDNESSEEKLLLNSGPRNVIDSTNENPTTTRTQDVEAEVTTEVEVELTTMEKPTAEAPKRPNLRRFPTATRRKQRIRPMMNTTYKSQLSRDMIALNARKYFNNRRRNSTQEWKDLIPMMKKNMSNEYINKTDIETTTLNDIEETTTLQELENCTRSADTENEQNNTSNNLDEIAVNTNQQNKIETDIDDDIVQPKVNVTERPVIQLTTTQAFNASGLRRQAFNNRLKKKRQKQKNLTTEPPHDDIMMNLFGIPNLVSSSEFISQTQGPKTSLDDVTILEDFMTTEMPHKHTNRAKTTRHSSPRPATTPQFVNLPSSTEETAQIELEEMFSDTQTKARLSKILKERNMTLSELFEHRERGSSHVHLADIFHNASKEPNPPEPFLSKSLIEPISKETYPLIALLDANNHDTTAKATTIEPMTVAVQTTEANIPVIMDFGNNVNENAENMGIMSLFHNIKNNGTNVDTKTLKKDSQGTLYETSITVVNTTDVRNGSDTIRESRVIHVANDNQDDIVSWNEIFSLMRSNYENQTEELRKTTTTGLIPAEKIKKPTLEKDLDGDGLIVLEDLQHLKDFDTNIASASSETLDFNSYERAESTTTKEPGVLDTIPNQTKSVTVVTACIAGLAIVLLLLTYAGYRWQQQRTMARKKSFEDERVPTPVFEHRKGHKNNSSTRSISPMLSSNIYTLNTLDSRNGKESPDYMWDSLRKPFQ